MQDEILRRAVGLHGAKNWKLIGESGGAGGLAVGAAAHARAAASDPHPDAGLGAHQ